MLISEISAALPLTRFRGLARVPDIRALGTRARGCPSLFYDITQWFPNFSDLGSTIYFRSLRRPTQRYSINKILTKETK